MKRRNVIIYLASIVFAVFIIYRTAHHDYYSAVTVTGATPLALAEKVPSGVRLEVAGRVKKTYSFGTSSLRAFAATRIRTREISPGGDFLGSYIYAGIPAFNILEGVAPSFPENSPVNFPTDFLVTFVTASGEKAVFSYGEILMSGDDSPVTLAYHMKELLPTKDPESYALNIRKAPLDGLRLVAPRDADTARYLDDVVSIVLSTPEVGEGLLPVRKKAFECIAGDIAIIEGRDTYPASFQGVLRSDTAAWIKVGHGKGFRGISTVGGYSLRSFIEKNVPDFSLDDFFLFASCDGYRCLFSAREIFATPHGKSMILIDNEDGSPPPGGIMLGCIADYFIDRSIRAVSHMLVIRPGAGM